MSSAADRVRATIASSPGGRRLLAASWAALPETWESPSSLPARYLEPTTPATLAMDLRPHQEASTPAAGRQPSDPQSPPTATSASYAASASARARATAVDLSDAPTEPPSRTTSGTPTPSGDAVDISPLDVVPPPSELREQNASMRHKLDRAVSKTDDDLMDEEAGIARLALAAASAERYAEEKQELSRRAASIQASLGKVRTRTDDDISDEAAGRARKELAARSKARKEEAARALAASNRALRARLERVSEKHDLDSHELRWGKDCGGERLSSA